MELGAEMQPRIRPGETNSLGINLDIAKGGNLSFGLDNLDLIFFSLVLFFPLCVLRNGASTLSKYRDL